jgi:hypothetical protein
LIWRFSDSTTVELGGKVEGPSLFAQRLRAEIADAEAGEPGALQVHIWPQPSEPRRVDLNDAALVHAWLERELDLLNRIDDVIVKMRSKPENLPALPPPPWADQPEPPADAIH